MHRCFPFPHLTPHSPHPPMFHKREFTPSEHFACVPGDSKSLIVCISMYNGLVMQDQEENELFFNPHYKSINEKLEIYDEEIEYNRLIKPEERVDQMVNFFRLMQMHWKDTFHEYKIMGSFIESIMKTFNFKMELSIHDLVWKSKEIGLLQTGFVEESEEDTAPLFEIYQSKDFRNRALSKFLTSFFSSRGLEYLRKKKEPENFRLGDFLEEDREGIQLYGISLFVNRQKFLADFDDRNDGLFVLKKIIDEFYSELEHVFEIRNAIVSQSHYKREEEIDKRSKKELPKNKRKSHYMKADKDQFFIKWDWQGMELLDFVHLKIWFHPDEYDLEGVIIQHLPDLEFNYASCTKKEYEAQKERLRMVL